MDRWMRAVRKNDCILDGLSDFDRDFAFASFHNKTFNLYYLDHPA